MTTLVTTKRALVTGGTGFLGRNLVEELIEQGWQVAVMCRRSSLHILAEYPSVELVEADLADPASVTNAVPEGLDCIFHLAGDTSFWRPNNARQWAINVEGTRSIVLAARNKHVKRLVHTSSVGIYGAAFKSIDETSPHMGADSWIQYMRSKAEAEVIVRQAIDEGLSATIMNPCNIVGAFDTNNWSRLFKMIDEASLPGVPPGSGVFCHARTVARAHVTAFEKGRDGENYILGGVYASQLEFVQLASRLLGRKMPVKATPAFLLKLFGRLALWGSYLSGTEPEITPELADVVCSHQSVDTDKAYRELDYQSPSLEQMCQETIDWMRTEDMLSPLVNTETALSQQP